jgi:hypothetical protein
VLLGGGIVEEVGDGRAWVGGCVEGGVKTLLEDIEDGIEGLLVIIIVLGTRSNL